MRKNLFTFIFLSFLIAQMGKAEEPFDFDPSLFKQWLSQGKEIIEQTKIPRLPQSDAKFICYNFMYPGSSGIGNSIKDAMADSRDKMVVNRCLQTLSYSRNISNAAQVESQFLPPGTHPRKVLKFLEKHQASLNRIMKDQRILERCLNSPSLKLVMGGGLFFGADSIMSANKCGPIDGDYSWIKDVDGEPQKFRGSPNYIDIYSTRPWNSRK